MPPAPRDARRSFSFANSGVRVCLVSPRKKRRDSNMVRVIPGIWMVLMALCQCLAADDSQVEPPVYRYLILIESSDAMAARKELALDTVHQLILSGLNGKIHRGEILGIWPFNTQVDRKLSRPMHWSPNESRDFANFIYRKLRDLRFSNAANLNSAEAAIFAEGSRSELLTVFLITTGNQPIRGTPFDDEINTIFRDHGDSMAKANRPFVSVLVFAGGRVVAQAVSPGGLTVYIPEAAAAPVDTPVNSEAPSTEVAEPAMAMTVEEISAKLKESVAQSPATNELATTELNTSKTEPSIEAEPEAVKSPVAAPEPEEEAEPAAVPAAPGKGPGVQTQRTEVAIEPEPQTPVESTKEAASDQPAVEPGAVTNEAGRSTLAASPKIETDAPVAVEMATPAMVQPVMPARKGRWIYLVVGAGLLLLAILILGWRIECYRRRSHASVISQAMHRR